MLEKQGLQPVVALTTPYAHGMVSAWSTVAGAFLLQFAVAGTCTAFGAFQDFYTEVWLDRYTATDISWIGGVQYFIELGFAPVAGKLHDAGLFRVTVVTGSILSTLCCFMLSLVRQNRYYQVFLAQAIGMGVSSALIYLPTTTLVSQHHRKHRSLAMGAVTCGAPLGAIVFSLLLNRLFYSHSFEFGMRMLGFISIGCCLLGNLLISMPPTSPLPTLNDSSQQSFETSSTSSPDPSKELEGSIVSTAKQPPLFDRVYILCLCSVFISGLGCSNPSFFIQLYARTQGSSKQLAFDSVAILNASSIIGRTLPTHFADRVGAMNLYIPSLVLLGLTELLMLTAQKAVGMVIFCVIYGFLFGSMIALYLPMVAEISPPGARMGARMGIALTPVGISTLVGPAIAGATLGKAFTWWHVIVLSSIFMLAASLFNVAAWILQRRHRLKVASRCAPA